MSLPFAVEAKVRCRNQVWEVIKITDNQDGTFVVRMMPEGDGKPAILSLSAHAH